jgi:hypothetical protein
MRTRTLVALWCGLAVVTTAAAETIVIDGQVQLRESAVDRPKRGLSMSEVETRFGAPAERHPTVGQPPITRWDYATFSVFFEHDRVIHSVAIGAPAAPASPAAAPPQPQAAAQAPLPPAATAAPEQPVEASPSAVATQVAAPEQSAQASASATQPLQADYPAQRDPQPADSSLKAAQAAAQPSHP